MPVPLSQPLPLSGANSVTSAAGASENSVTPSAKGDPHLQNIYGQRFDLMAPGRHILLHIPKGAGTVDTLLRVDAEARQMGHKCADMYFRELNITGSWAEVRQAGGIKFRADEVDGELNSSWMTFGKVDLKVIHGHTQQGIQYLNVYVKHLGHTGLHIGGLLGEDDHSKEEIPVEECGTRIALRSYGKKVSFQNGTNIESHLRHASVAEASLA